VVTASAAFERFRFSFFEDTNSARDGLDTVALAQIEGEEGARAEHMLIGCLPDARGVIGLGVLRSRRAEPQLAQLFEAERRAQLEAKLAPDGFWLSDGLVYLAKALWQIGPRSRLGAEWLRTVWSAIRPGRCRCTPRVPPWRARSGFNS
jgi:hypothetical protein